MSIITANQIKSLSGTTRNVDSLLESTNTKTINGVSIVGSGDITITSSAHTHAIADVNNLQTALDGKQAVLVSGTNIKTINGTALTGSGDISVWSSTNDGTGSGLDADLLDGQHASAFQPVLVSGTNIKTINGVSVLGSGDIVISTSGGEAFSAF